MKSALIFLTMSFCFCLFYLPLAAQDIIPSYETSSGSTPSDNSGAKISFTHDLLLDTNNPFTPSFSTVSQPITVTYTISNQPYLVSQDTNNDSDGTNNPATVFGWDYSFIPVGGDEFLRAGQSRNILQQLNFLTQSQPTDDNFTSLKSVTHLSNSPNGDGINVDQNYAVNFSIGFEGLGDIVDDAGTPGVDERFDVRHDVGTLTITFSEPVNDPVIHLKALGARWTIAAEADGSVLGQESTRYYNTATTDFDFDPANSTPGIGTPVILSGTIDSNGPNFVVENIGGVDVIRNSSPNPGVNSNESIGGTPFAVAHGSVLFPGEDITDIVLNLKANFMDARDVVVSGSGDVGGVNYVQTIYGDTDGLGWAGGGTDSQESFTLPQINFSNDVLIISASTDAPVSTELTGDECYRMLSFPDQSTTYQSFLDPLWTQGAINSDYNVDNPDPHIFTWPAGNNFDSGALGTYNGYTPVPDLNSRPNDGEGYLISVFENDEFGVDEPFNTKTLTLEGSENDPFTFNNTGDSDGWILFGNPFKSSIDIVDFFDNAVSGQTGLTQAVYIWDRNYDSGNTDFVDPTIPGSWRVWTPSDSDIANNLIAPFQAFFVQKNATSSSVNFNDDIKNTSTTVSGSFYGKNVEKDNLVRLEINGESLYNKLSLHFSNEGSFERTIGDALELTPLSYDYASLSTRKTDDNLYTIGHYPLPSNDFEIPIQFEVTRSGNYTIDASYFKASFPHDLYFVDLENEESIRIDESFSYTFSVNQAEKDGTAFNLCSDTQVTPKIAQKQATTDRFLITTQPKEFGSELPTDVALNQNYPNPFNPTTQITYQLPQQSDVRLQVFDMAGRQVATLVNESVNAGTHTVNFDASSLSSGVYLYKLQAGSTVLTRKLTLIK